jgi:hypothetical protein
LAASLFRMQGELFGLQLGQQMVGALQHLLVGYALLEPLVTGDRQADLIAFIAHETHRIRREPRALSVIDSSRNPCDDGPNATS